MSDKTTAYLSGRTQDQFIRLAVIEGRKAYVPPGLFAKMNETAINPLLTEMQRAEEQQRWLMLTPNERLVGKVSGFEVIVDYEMQDMQNDEA